MTNITFLRPGEQGLLEHRYPPSILDGRILPPAQYHPFPTADERSAWEALPTELRRQLIAAGVAHLGSEWPALPAVLYLDYTRSGDRQGYETLYFRRRRHLLELALAECVAGQGQFLDDLLNGIWAICEESSWVLPAHNGHVPGYNDAVTGPLPATDTPIIDLFAAETANLLAWVAYLLGNRLDTISPQIRARIRQEVDQRILTPFLAVDAFWWMCMGEYSHVNNWTPWCASNCLAATLLLEEDTTRRTDAVTKTLHILDRFIAAYPEDGGCDEGPSYWTRAGGALLDALEQLCWATAGLIDVFDDPRVANIGRFIARAHISGGWYVNFADSGPHPDVMPALVYRYGRRIHDASLAQFGAGLFQRILHGREQGTTSFNYDELTADYPLVVLTTLFLWQEMAVTPAANGVRDVWLPSIQMMTARETAGSDHGWFLAMKGGHNAESHNHNDVGQVIAYYDGQPVLIDVGVGTYTRQTFSAQRYDIWTMQSAYHNLPTVNGVQQAPGQEYAAGSVAYAADELQAELTVDLAPAYPTTAGLLRWRRTGRLLRSSQEGIEVCEDLALRDATDDIVLTFLTPCSVVPEAPGLLRFTLADGQEVTLSFDEQALTAELDSLPLTDPTLREAWRQEQLSRIRLRPGRVVQSTMWTWRLQAAGEQ